MVGGKMCGLNWSLPVVELITVQVAIGWNPLSYLLPNGYPILLQRIPAAAFTSLPNDRCRSFYTHSMSRVGQNGTPTTKFSTVLNNPAWKSWSKRRRLDHPTMWKPYPEQTIAFSLVLLASIYSSPYPINKYAIRTSLLPNFARTAVLIYLLTLMCMQIQTKISWTGSQRATCC